MACADQSAHEAAVVQDLHRSDLDGSTLYVRPDSMYLQQDRKMTRVPLVRNPEECLSPFAVELNLGTSSRSPARFRNAINGQ